MSSGFVSENELAERRRIRQEEWEKVRQPDQPLEVPEETYDHRSLFERLEEQKQKKQLEYEEAHKLKNMIKGLDDDEVEFLDLVDQKKLEAEQRKELEEKQELLDFRKKVGKLKETSIDQRIQAEIRPAKLNNGNSSGLKSQHHLLKGVVVKRKVSDDPVSSSPKKVVKLDEVKPQENNDECCKKKRKRSDNDSEDAKPKFQADSSSLTCVGILPGLCSYAESSDESDHSCSSASDANGETTKYDLVGRKIVYKTKEKTG